MQPVSSICKFDKEAAGPFSPLDEDRRRLEGIEEISLQEFRAEFPATVGISIFQSPSLSDYGLE